MWASQHIECAIRNSILLMKGVESFVTPQRERFMCAVKPFEVNCILLSFCACNIVCSSLYSAEDDALCLPRSCSHPALCLFLYSITVWTHLPICLGTQRWRLLPVAFECISPRTLRVISQLLRWLEAVEGWDKSGCDRDLQPPPTPKAVISVTATAQKSLGVAGGICAARIQRLLI